MQIDFNFDTSSYTGKYFDYVKESSTVLTEVPGSDQGTICTAEGALVAKELNNLWILDKLTKNRHNN